MSPPVASRGAVSTPLDAVLAWWQAVQDRDLAALGRLLDDEHVSVGGPGGRSLGRHAALAGAAAFTDAGSVDSWSVRDAVQVGSGDVVVCSYLWEETGSHAGTPFQLAGLATDVLALRGDGWVLLAHHASVLPPAATRDGQP